LKINLALGNVLNVHLIVKHVLRIVFAQSVQQETFYTIKLVKQLVQIISLKINHLVHGNVQLVKLIVKLVIQILFVLSV
jgi:phenylalanine-4-hydroxylase